MELLKKAFRKYRKKLATITVEKVHYCFCLMLILGAVMYVTVDNASIKSQAQTDSEDQLSDYSFYTLASATAAAFSTDLADTDHGGPEEAMKTYFVTLNPASGGGILAYCDSDTKGLIGMFMNAVSLSSASKSYASLDGKSFKNDWTSSGMSPFAHYVSLGATLTDLGIDSTGSAAETIGAFSGRMMTGSIVEIVFLLSQSVVLVFGVVVKCLKVLNPFTFFQSCTVPGGTHFQTILQGIATRNGLTGFSSTVQSSISVFIASFYNYLFTAGWALLSVSFVIMIIKVCFPMTFGSGPRGSFGLMKTWLTKVMFLIGGIAILGVTYTDVLNWLDDQTNSGNGAAEKVIASTFCDFENWAYAGMPLTGISISTNYSDGAITASASNNVQDLCYKINSSWNSTLPVTSLGNTYSGSGAENVKELVSQVQNNSNGHGGANSSEDAFSWVLSTLDRYKLGTKITSSAYESAWKNVYWSLATTDESKALQEYFKCFGSANAINQADETSTSRYSDNSLGWAEISSFNIANPFGAGGNTTDTGNNKNNIPSTASPSSAIGPWWNLRYSRSYDTNVSYDGTVLSAMSIYNYLNTTFETSEMVVYSSSKSSSNYIRDSHYSISLVGKGSSSAIILIMCITLLLCYTVLGFAYGFGIVFTNIKRGFRLLIAVPGAMLGSLQAIAKVVSYTVLMIFEIVINVFLYCLTTEMLYTLATDFTQLIQNYTATLLGTTVVAVVQPLISIVIIIALWWFTIKCIQLRKPIIKSAEEAADNVISKFIIGADRGGSTRANVSGAAGGSGGGGGTGLSAGKAKPPTSIGDSILHPGQRNKARIEAKKAKGEAKANMLLGQMGIGSGTSSAVKEEEALDSYRKAEKENKKQARKEKAQGAAKAVVGAAEVAAGAATGNAALTARGASNMAQGSIDMQNAAINATNNSAALANQASQAIGGRRSEKAAQAPSNNVAIEKFDAVKEATGAASAAIGGVDGLAAAGGSGSEVASAMSNVKSLAGAYKATGGDTAALANAVSSGDYAGAVRMVAGNQGVKTLSSGGSLNVDTSSVSTSASMSHSKMNSVQTVDSEVTQIAGKATVNRASGNGSDSVSVSASGGIKNTSAHGITATQTVTDTLNVQQQTVTAHQSVGLRNSGGSVAGPQRSSMSGNNYTQTVNDSYTVNHNANVNEVFANAGSYGGGRGGYRPSSGSARSYDVTDTVNVNRRQQVNYQDGGTSVNGSTRGKGYVPTSGTSMNHEVTDNINISRRQRTTYKEIREGDAPKRPNKS